MNVEGLHWIGVKTADVRTMAEFFERVLGLRRRRAEDDFAVLDLPGGGELDVFGPGGPDPDFQFASNQVEVGFDVSDFDSAIAELMDKGVELLGEVRGDRVSGRWQHFRGPDGKVFEITEHPSHQPGG
ncbi:MAG TPA: VOC family protein [Candidatus Dormibacteraeota bacterium]|nr:VOC family protein [Candidatus Dormibacteraeota bacterium]